MRPAKQERVSQAASASPEAAFSRAFGDHIAEAPASQAPGSPNPFHLAG
jgi:hypothetical protein